MEKGRSLPSNEEAHPTGPIGGSPPQESPATDPAPAAAKKEEPARVATGITGAAAIALLVLQQTGVADITIGEAVAYLFTLFATLNERTREKVEAKAKA